MEIPVNPRLRNRGRPPGSNISFVYFWPLGCFALHFTVPVSIPEQPATLPRTRSLPFMRVFSCLKLPLTVTVVVPWFIFAVALNEPSFTVMALGNSPVVAPVEPREHVPTRFCQSNFLTFTGLPFLSRAEISTP